MAKTNFQYEKRQRELEKKRKNEEKAKRKAEGKATPQDNAEELEIPAPGTDTEGLASGESGD
ncbi:MAG TPA: hypothetical protein VIT92_12255 [Burkholderiaceae bacterium]